MNDAVCALFKSGRWNEFSKSAFLTIKYHSPESLILQHFPIKEKISISYKNNRLEEINRSRNVDIIVTLNAVDIVEIIKCGGVVLEVYEGFICHNMQNRPYTEFVNDMVGKRDLFNKK